MVFGSIPDPSQHQPKQKERAMKIEFERKKDAVVATFKMNVFIDGFGRLKEVEFAEKQSPQVNEYPTIIHRPLL
jgi:hypothetical protein